MKRILLILGEIIFTENEDGTPKQAEILDVTITLYVDEDKEYNFVGLSWAFRFCSEDDIRGKLGRLCYNCFGFCDGFV